MKITTTQAIHGLIDSLPEGDDRLHDTVIHDGQMYRIIVARMNADQIDDSVRDLVNKDTKEDTMNAAEIEDLVETIPAQCGLFASTTRTCYAEGGESLTVQVRLVPAEEYASLDDWVFMHEDGLDYPRLRDMVCDFIIENRGNDMGKSDIEGRDRYPHLHPEELEKRDKAVLAEMRARRDYLDSWIGDELTPEAQADPLVALIEDDSGLLQRFVSASLNGDLVEFERVAEVVANALVAHIKANA